MKQRTIYAAIAVIIIVISVIGVRHYLEHQRYEKHLSMQVANEFTRLTGAIRVNQTIYEEILHSKTLSQEQAETLVHNNYSIVNIAQKHKNLVFQLKRSNQDLNNIPANKASDIAFYFEGLIWDIAESQGEDVANKINQFPSELPKSNSYPIKTKEVEKVEKIKEINDLWLQAIASNVKGVSDDGKMTALFDEYRDKGITSEYWVKVVEVMDKKTEEYLDENYLPLN